MTEGATVFARFIRETDLCFRVREEINMLVERRLFGEFYGKLLLKDGWHAYDIQKEHGPELFRFLQPCLLYQRQSHSSGIYFYKHCKTFRL